MAYCGNCGKYLAEGEVCNCKTTPPVSEQPPVQSTVQPINTPIAPSPEQPPEKKKFNAAAIVLVIILLLILVLAGIAVYMFLDKEPEEKENKKDKEEKTKKTSYMDPVDNFLKEFNDRNADYVEVFATLMPKDAAELYKEVNKLFEDSEEYMATYEDDVEYVEECYYYTEDEYGEWKLSFEKEDAVKLTEDDLEDLNDELAYYYEDNLEYLEYDINDVLEYDLDSVAEDFGMESEDMEKLMNNWLEYLEYYKELEVTAAYEVTGIFVCETKDDTYESEEVTFCIGKINGSWTYLGFVGDSLYFGDELVDLSGLLNDYLDGERFYMEIYF